MIEPPLVVRYPIDIRVVFATATYTSPYEDEASTSVHLGVGLLT
jgi:hypothetical protein